MRGYFISLILICALLFGNTHVAAFAHTHSDEPGHAAQLLDSDHHFIDVSDDDNSKPDAKGDVAQHHHCSSVLAVEPSAPCTGSLIERSRVFPTPTAAMDSLSGAPPTQPPAA